ncbi:MAG: hypothetical protein ACI8S6_000737 [Myxococcota bacterium]|jgi:uncharacterized protein (TIGR02466 family)
MNRSRLFSTPLLTAQVEGTASLNGALAALLSEEASSVPSRLHSNAGGWHSAQDLTRRTAAPFRSLTAMLTHHLQQGLHALVEEHEQKMPDRLAVSAQAWAMVMQSGDHSLAHHHGESHMSCVYYVDPGDPPPPDDPDAGALVFLDPRGAISGGPLSLYPPLHTLRPAPGLLAMFPGYLLHFVRPYRGQRPRISVAANFVLR